jgi:hypothetical protein
VLRFVHELVTAGPPGWDAEYDTSFSEEGDSEAGAGVRGHGSPGSSAAAGQGEETELIVYVMDSLGERLCEGCKRGYILRFDSASDRSDGEGEGEGEDRKGSAAAAAARFIGRALHSSCPFQPNETLSYPI